MTTPWIDGQVGLSTDVSQEDDLWRDEYGLGTYRADIGCIYASGRRLMIPVPHGLKDCVNIYHYCCADNQRPTPGRKLPYHDPVRTWCRFVPNGDPAHDGVKLYPAETLGLDTEIGGFRLRWTRDQVDAAISAVNGVAISSEAGALVIMLADKRKVHLEFASDPERTARIIVEPAKLGDKTAFDAMTRRFWFRNRYSFKSETPSWIWNGEDGVRLNVTYPDPSNGFSQIILLTDTTASALK